MKYFLPLLTVLLFVICVVWIWGCGGSSSGGSPSLCEANHTATVYFQNRFGNVSLDFIWDGIKTVTLGPGEKSSAFTVSATQHTSYTRITGTSITACGQATPSPAQCSTLTLQCPAP
jgi:hypothetical protein